MTTELITVAVAAKRLGVQPERVRDLINEGVLEVYIARSTSPTPWAKRFVSESEVEAYRIYRDEQSGIRQWRGRTSDPHDRA